MCCFFCCGIPTPWKIYFDTFNFMELIPVPAAPRPPQWHRSSCLQGEDCPWHYSQWGRHSINLKSGLCTWATKFKVISGQWEHLMAGAGRTDCLLIPNYAEPLPTPPYPCLLWDISARSGKGLWGSLPQQGGVGCSSFVVNCFVPFTRAFCCCHYCYEGLLVKMLNFICYAFKALTVISHIILFVLKHIGLPQKK